MPAGTSLRRRGRINASDKRELLPQGLTAHDQSRSAYGGNSYGGTCLSSCRRVSGNTCPRDPSAAFLSNRQFRVRAAPPFGLPIEFDRQRLPVTYATINMSQIVLILPGA